MKNSPHVPLRQIAEEKRRGKLRVLQHKFFFSSKNKVVYYETMKRKLI
jgi:hypothetical protein